MPPAFPSADLVSKGSVSPADPSPQYKEDQKTQKAAAGKTKADKPWDSPKMAAPIQNMSAQQVEDVASTISEVTARLMWWREMNIVIN
jgi:hypothetical protein